MGQMVVIRLKAKDDKSITAVNKLLKKARIDNSFITEQNNIDWLEDINTNPKSPQKHLKPLTLIQLKTMFNLYCEIGALNFDMAFGRTSQTLAKKYAKFILKYADLIQELQGAQSMLERYDFTLTKEEQLIIKKLNKVPVAERTKRDLQGGLMLCKSWSSEPFWVVFGKTINNYPIFMKDKQYEDENYNNLYRDDNGYAYLLIPLLPINNVQLEFVEKVYNDCWSMGLRESYNLFIPFIYGLDIVNTDKVAEDYREFYTGEELREKFWFIFKATNSMFPYNNANGFIWRQDKLAFTPCGTPLPSMQTWARCHILTAILRAIGPEVSAELMSNLTGKPYKKFEFTK